jgi:hypothetical protein
MKKMTALLFLLCSPLAVVALKVGIPNLILSALHLTDAVQNAYVLALISGIVAFLLGIPPILIVLVGA